MMPNRMKPETLEETRDRLLEMSAAERRGFDAVSEGQLNPIREGAGDPDGPEQELHQLQDTLRLRTSIQDRPDDEAVRQTQESVAAPLDERRTARRTVAEPEAPKTQSTRRTSRKPADGEATGE
jgi:hypothetical protein